MRVSTSVYMRGPRGSGASNLWIESWRVGLVRRGQVTVNRWEELLTLSGTCAREIEPVSRGDIVRRFHFSSSTLLILNLRVQALFSSSYLEAFPTTPSRRPSAPRGLSAEVQARGPAAAARALSSMSLIALTMLCGSI